MTSRIFLALIFSLIPLATACSGNSPRAVASGEESGPSETNPGTLSGAITAAWANDGGDKVTQDELRASTSGLASVRNTVWDGQTIQLFGAMNEVISFNLVLEAGRSDVSQVSVVFDNLDGPRGGVIHSNAPSDRDGVFNWTDRNIENFFVRYLQIKGLSLLSYENYDERHIPKRLRRPWTGDGAGAGSWADRPDHDKFYPDIAAPLELHPTFDITQGHNQSIWTDIYIPKEIPRGIYQGAVKVYEAGKLTQFLPVRLSVKNFTLPDEPSAKTMIYLGSDMNVRYTGETWPLHDTSEAAKARLVRDRHFSLAHRHKLSLIDAESGVTGAPGDHPSAEWLPRLDGTLFSAANGYAGPGTDLGNGVYSVGTYGSWGWQDGGEASMWKHTDAWERWFEQNFPDTERFLYLVDESSDFTQIQQWAKWMNANPGPGHNLRSMATIDAPTAHSETPDLGIVTSWFTVGDPEIWNSTVSAQIAAPAKRYYQYNGKRPAQGSFATDDDGVALRELSWAQYKKGIQRWMFWESTYYNDYQGRHSQTNVFETAATFSGEISQDELLGETGWNHSNGDGLLFYPGTDTLYPDVSYDLAGPIASLRLKHWRRGVQDVDYITLANAINPEAVSALVNQMVPKAMWDYGLDNLADPTYVHTDISWSINPDDWEAARARLAAIILGQ